MHAHRVSVLSNIQFKLSLLFIFSSLTTIITQGEFFFPCREHSCDVVLVSLPEQFLSPVCCVPKPYLHRFLCPTQRRQQTVILCLSIVSLIPVGSIGRSQSLKAFCDFWCDKWPFLPLVFLIWTFPSMPKTRRKNAAPFLFKGLSGVRWFFLIPARE